MGKLTIHETRFTEDEISVYDGAGQLVEYGDIPYDEKHTTTTEYDGVGAREAADILERYGLSFAATGSDWAGDPDGSYISDYATGERIVTSGHLSGFHPRVFAAIVESVS